MTETRTICLSLLTDGTTYWGYPVFMSESLTPKIAATSARPRWLLVTMIVLSVGYAGLFAFSILGAMVSPMVFDAGETPKAWHAFFAFLFFPVLVLISVALSWCGFGFRRYVLIPVGCALPVIYGIVFWLSFS